MVLIFYIFFLFFLVFIWGGWSSRITGNTQIWKILSLNPTDGLGQDGLGDPHYGAPDNLQIGHVQCVSLTISYPLCFCNSKVSRMLHHGLVVWFYSKEWYLNRVHCLLFSAAGDRVGRGVEPPIKFSKKVAWQDLNFYRGLLVKRGWLFIGWLKFSHKKKLKSVIPNDKKSL